MSSKLKLWEGEVVLIRRSHLWDTKYALNTYDRDRCEIRLKNCIFYQEFEFKNFGRGRSSVTAEYISLDKVLEVSMFISNVGELIKSNTSLKVLKGYFCFVKKGANIGITYLGENIPESNLEVNNLNLEIRDVNE